jgi:hypothetical protein
MTKLDKFLVGFNKAFYIVDFELFGKILGYSVIGTVLVLLIALLITFIEYSIFKKR